MQLLSSVSDDIQQVNSVYLEWHSTENIKKHRLNITELCLAFQQNESKLIPNRWSMGTVILAAEVLR